MVGRHCREVFGRLCRKCYDCPLDQVLTSGRKLTYDSQLHLPDGRVWWGRTHCYPLKDRRGRVLGGFLITIDINDEKQVEAPGREIPGRPGAEPAQSHPQRTGASGRGT